MSEEATQIVHAPPAEESVEVMRLKNERSLEKFSSPFESAAALRHYTAAATVFAKSQLVPKHLQGRTEDCLILMNMALRMQEDPLLVLQNCFVVSGTPGFKTQFLIARANASGQLKSKIRWNVEKLDPAWIKVDGFDMPNLRVTASAVDNFGELMESAVTTDMAIREKWITNPKYRSMPEHMLRWRSAAFLIRLYMPEVMMGMQTIEEIEDVTAANPQALVAPSQGMVRLSDLKRVDQAGAPPATVTFGEPEVIEIPPQEIDRAFEAGEDPPEEKVEADQIPVETTPEPTTAPVVVDERDGLISDEVKNTLRGMLQGRNVTKAALSEYLDTEFGIASLAGLKARDVVQVTAWITKLPMKG